MKQIKIKLDKITNYELKGFVLVDDLPSDILEALHIETYNCLFDGVSIGGEYTVCASQDDAEVDSVTVYLYNTVGNETFEIDISNDDRFDLHDLHEQIFSQGDTYEWYLDKLDAKAESQYESYLESQWDE